jgi:hypothetical protein
LSVTALSTSFAYAKAQGTAFALIGDRHHNSDYIRISLGKTLEKDLGVPIDFTDEVELLNAEEIQGYRLLIVFRDGGLQRDGYVNDFEAIQKIGHMDNSSNAGYVKAGTPKIISVPPLPKVESKNSSAWITAAQGKAVKAFVSGGGSALFYHNAGYISPNNDDFRDVFGGVRQGHPKIRPFKVKVVNKEHPITRGVNDFVVTDEQHFLDYQKDPKYLLLQSVNEDGLTHRDLGTSSAAGWAYDYGKGRVCYLAPGHLMTVLWNTEYEKIQQNAVRWLLRQI